MSVNDVRVWAFNKPDTEENVRLLYESVKNGKSRFGWSSEERHNLKIDRENNWENNWTKEHGRALFLLKIKPGNWIVHINMPSYGRCAAARVVSEYDFDEGINTSDGQDFRHFFRVDSIVEFERNSKKIHTAVNLEPRQRYHEVSSAKEFKRSIKAIKDDEEIEIEGSRERHDLLNETDEVLEEISRLIHRTHRGKKLESFLAEVYRKIPGVSDVRENGSSGRKGDHGADLIVTTKTSVGNLEIKNMIVVQVKSYKGDVLDTKAVEQIEKALDHYKEANAGVIITTGKRTETLENAVAKARDKLRCDIDLLTGKELAQFVIHNAADQLFRLL